MQYINHLLIPSCNHPVLKAIKVTFPAQVNMRVH